MLQKVFTVYFFENGVYVSFSTSSGFPRKHFAALGLKKIEEVEYSVCTWKRRVSFLCDFLVLETFDVDI